MAQLHFSYMEAPRQPAADGSSEGDSEQQNSDLTNDAANRNETAQLPCQITSPAGDSKHEQTSEIHSLIVDPEQKPEEDDSQQELESKPFPQVDTMHSEQQIIVPPDGDIEKEHAQPCPKDNASHGCQIFEGEDGREKINAEGFNIYSGEPENVVYDAADMISDRPQSAVRGNDGAMSEMQEISGDVKQEEKASPAGTQHSQEGGAAKNLMYNAAYDRVGQPAGSVVVEDDDGRDMQQLEQEEKSLPKENADLQDMREDVIIEQAGKPLSHAEDADVCVLQEGKPDNMSSDAAYAIGGQPASAANIDVDGVPDLQEDLDGIEEKHEPLREADFACNSQQGKKKSDVALECEDKTSIADMKSDDQTGMQQVRNWDQPLDVDDGVDVQGTMQYVKPEFPKEVGGEEHSKESEERSNITGLDEKQKNMARGGQQFVLNSPVNDVDYNAKGLPVAESKIDAQDKDATLSGENACTESPYEEFDSVQDYVKVGYGAEGFVPKHNEEVDTELREPVDREREKERSQTEELALDKSLQLDACGGASNGKAPELEGNTDIIHRSQIPDKGKFDEGVIDKLSEYNQHASDPYERPLAMPHPQPEDLAGYLNNNVAKDLQPDDDGQHREGSPHKKGVFERIKEKLTAPS